MSAVAVIYGPVQVTQSSRSLWQLVQEVTLVGHYTTTEYPAHIRRFKSRAKPGKPMHNRHYYKAFFERATPSPIFESYDACCAWAVAMVSLED